MLENAQSEETVASSSGELSDEELTEVVGGIDATTENPSDPSYDGANNANASGSDDPDPED